MNYTISQAAERMGVAPSTIRYYDQQGLIPNIRRKSGQRVFDDTDIRFLKLLNCLKNTGMPLKRIRAYVDMIKEGDKSIEKRYGLIKDQREFIMEQIEQMNYYLAELDFKDWYYRKALAQGTEKGIRIEDYEKETGQKAP